MGRFASFALEQDGRLRRGPLVVAWAVQGFAVAAMVAIAILVIDPAEDDPGAAVWGTEAAFLGIYLICVAASAYLGIRRLRQGGRSAWWCLVCLVPVVGPPWYLREVLRDHQPIGGKALNGRA